MILTVSDFWEQYDAVVKVIKCQSISFLTNTPDLGHDMDITWSIWSIWYGLWPIVYEVTIYLIADEKFHAGKSKVDKFLFKLESFDWGFKFWTEVHYGTQVW